MREIGERESTGRMVGFASRGSDRAPFARSGFGGGSAAGNRMWNELTFAWHGSGLTRLLDLAFAPCVAVGMLAVVLWVALLRRKPSGLRTAAGLLGLVLLPNAVLALLLVHQLRSVHGVWIALMLGVPVSSLLVALYAVGWTALYRRPFGDHECGRCRQQMHPEQSTCAECGWTRGRSTGVAQARMFAIAVIGGVTAATSLLALQLAMTVPLAWTAEFDVKMHDRPPSLLGGAATSGTVIRRLYGSSTHLRSPFARRWDPVGFSSLGFLCESAPGVWSTYLMLSGDERQYTPEFLAAFPQRLSDAMSAAHPALPRDEIEHTAAMQVGFVRAMKEKKDLAERSAKWTRIEVTEITPPLVLMLVPACAGPLVAVSVALLARRCRHHSA